MMMTLQAGLRRSELRVLEWRRIDTSARIVTVFGSKPGKTRQIPMSAALTEAVSAHPRHVASAYFLTSRRGRAPTPYADANNIYRHFQRLREGAGMPLSTFHLLRHTCASHLDAEGCPTRSIQKILGHSNIATTQRYTHPGQDALRAWIERVAKETS